MSAPARPHGIAPCAKPYSGRPVEPCRECGCECGGYRRDDPALCWRCHAAATKAQQGLGL